MSVPTVTAVAPVQGTAPQVAASQAVTVTGTGFYNGGASSAVTAIHFGATAATAYTVTADTSLVVIVPAHAAGTVDITVTTPGGTSTTSTADEFTYTPTIATQIVGQGGTALTFQAAATANVGDTFANDGATYLVIKNGSVSSMTATVKGVLNCSQGHLHDQVITVAASAEETAGPFPTSQYTNPVDGTAQVLYSATTTITVAAHR